MFRIVKKYPFLSHILFWVGVYLLDVIDGNIFKSLRENCIFGIAHILPQIAASYLTVYYLIPKFIPDKKYGKFIFWFVVSAYLISVFSRILVVHGAEPLTRIPPFEQETIPQIFSEVKWLVLRYFPGNYIMVFFFWLVTFLNFSRNNLSLQKEKTAAELKMLKAQLNPHFLFNTLNNIYSLSLDNAPKTSESIGRLSKILDYVLYRCDAKFVLLSGEIHLLEDYIALEKLRYDDRLKIKFEKNIERDIEIAPLILLSFVENAFKHGASEDNGSPEINIILQSKKGLFDFKVSNTVVDSDKKKSTSAIGLENIKKQLDLIYPNQYILDIKEEAKLFTVNLRLKL